MHTDIIFLFNSGVDKRHYVSINWNVSLAIIRWEDISLIIFTDTVQVYYNPNNYIKELNFSDQFKEKSQ